FLRRSLIELGAALERRGMPLFLLVANDFADVPALLERFARSIDARALFFNEEYAVNEQRRDQAVSQRLKPVLQTVNGYRDQSIWPVRSIRTAVGTPYKVFTPFKRRWLELAETSPMALWPKPSITRRPDAALMSAAALHAAHGATANTIDALFTGILPSSSSGWAVGESAAYDELESFMASRAEDYHRHRNQPAPEDTSRLSRYLANGTLSGRQCYVIASDTIRSPPDRTSTDVS